MAQYLDYDGLKLFKEKLDETYETNIDTSNFIASVMYDEDSNIIEFYNEDGTMISSIDTSGFTSDDSSSVSVDIVNNLTSTSTTSALSAYQGNVLKGLIDDIEDDIENIDSRIGTTTTTTSSVSVWTVLDSVSTTVNSLSDTVEDLTEGLSLSTSTSTSEFYPIGINADDTDSSTYLYNTSFSCSSGDISAKSLDLSNTLNVSSYLTVNKTNNTIELSDKYITISCEGLDSSAGDMNITSSDTLSISSTGDMNMTSSDTLSISSTVESSNAIRIEGDGYATSNRPGAVYIEGTNNNTSIASTCAGVYIKGDGVENEQYSNCGIFMAGSKTCNYACVISGGADYSLYVGSDAYIEGSIYDTSDERLKTDISDFDALSIIDNLNPISFKWNDKAQELNEKVDTTITNYGLIALECDGVIDGLVKKGKRDDDMWTVSYQKLIPILLKAIKELEEKNSDLEDKYNSLLEEIEKLE